MTNVSLYETKGQKQERERREEARANELRQLSGKGTVDELQAGIAKLETEERDLGEQLNRLRYEQGMRNTILLGKRPEADQEEAIRARRLVISLLLGDLGRALRAEKARRGEEMAVAFVKDNRAMYRDVAATWSAQLEHVATLANAYDDAVHAGAGASAMVAAPQNLLAHLRELLGWTRLLQGYGVDVRDALTPAVKARLEASR